MTSRQYNPLDEAVAEEIKRLHKRYPKLGHEGLLDALEQQGIEVDEGEMKNFVRKNKLGPGIAEQSWGWVASCWRLFPWGLPEQRPHDKRSQRRFWKRR